MNGGGLVGDADSDAALRLFGKGVVGRSGMAKGRSGAGMIVPPWASSFVDWDGGDVADGLVFRFFGAGVGLAIFSYFAVVGFGAFASGVLVALLFATRDERLRDMLYCVDGVVLVNGVT